MSTTAQISADRRTVLIGSTITLSVISNDHGLIGLCRDVLRELGEASALRDLEIGPDSRNAPNSEVCLLDWAGSRPAHHDRSGSGRIFYLVPPSEIEELLESTPDAEGSILLKPVTRAVLRAFLRSVNRGARRRN